MLETMKLSRCRREMNSPLNAFRNHEYAIIKRSVDDEKQVTINMTYVYNSTRNCTYVYIMPSGKISIDIDDDLMAIKITFKGFVHHRDTNRDTYDLAYRIIDEWYS